MNGFTHWRRAVAVAAALLLGVTGVAFGQAQTGNLYGTVVDNQGEALPGVTITVSGIGAPRVMVTNAEGQFRLLSLDPGMYSMTAELEGFSTVEYPKIEIRVGRNTTIEITLTPAVEDVITVTSESPLLDERRAQLGTTITQAELERIPTARDPWSVLNQTPGVLTDRINVGGNESGQQAVFLGPGSNSDENTFAVDGVVITDMEAVGASPTYYDFDQFTEMQITTGGTDVSTSTAGVTMNLVTKRGTNDPRGSARFLLTDPVLWKTAGLEQGSTDVSGQLARLGQPGVRRTQTSISGNSINEILDLGVEGGGPAIQDKLWLWGSYGRNDIKIIAAGGTADNTLLENIAFKVNAQVSGSNSGVVSFNRGDKIKDGRGAGPSRALETTWDQSGPSEIWKAEDTHVFNSNFYLTGLWSLVDGGFQLIPKGGLTDSSPEALWDSDGVFKNSYIGGGDNRDTELWQVDGSYFFNTGSATNHEIKFGAQFREFEVTSNFRWPGERHVLNIAGENFGTSQPVNFFQVGREGPNTKTSDYQHLWVQDTISSGNWTFNVGFRMDQQEGQNLPASVSPPCQPSCSDGSTFPIFGGADLVFPGNTPEYGDWQTITPRVGVTYALGPQRKTLLRASYSQFAQQLASSAHVGSINPVGSAYAYYLFYDGDGDRLYDNGESKFFLFGSGFNPLDPLAASSSNEYARGLDPEITNEIALGVEHAFLPEFVVSAQYTWRKTDDIITSFTKIVDGSTVRRATRGDYELVPTPLTGQNPDGSSYSEPYYTLRSGLDYFGGSVIDNSERSIEYSGVALGFTKRLANRWMARGYFNYGEPKWDVPTSFLAQVDPTDGVGGGDNDGALFAEQSGGSGNKGDVFLQSTWSANLNGMYQFPWFDVAVNIFAREGYPLPYFRSVTPSDGVSRSVTTTGGVIDAIRTEDVLTVDLSLSKEFRASDNFSLTFQLDAFNLFDEQYVLQRERNLSSSRANHLDEVLSPRIYRAGVRLSWR